jgi:hypothetical protein
MPYDIRQNYRGKSGYSVVSPDGSVRGTHSTRQEAVSQQRALYAAEQNSKKEVKKMEHNLYEELPPAEKKFHDSLVSIAKEYGPLDSEETGIWIGYESAAQNADAAIGVMCGNCSLHYEADDGTIGCMILSYAIEEGGKCRLAAIPPGYINTSKSVWGGRFL